MKHEKNIDTSFFKTRRLGFNVTDLKGIYQFKVSANIHKYYLKNLNDINIHRNGSRIQLNKTIRPITIPMFIFHKGSSGHYHKSIDIYNIVSRYNVSIVEIHLR